MTDIAPGAPRKRRWGRWIGLAMGLLLLAGVAAFAWDGWQLKAASADLRAHASAAQAAVTNRDADALVTEVGAVQDASAKFVAATTGPHWLVASWIPLLKQQTVPLQQAGASVKAIADDALGPLASMDDLSALQVPAIVDGRIDPNVLEPYKATLATSAAVFTTQQKALADVSLAQTVAAVRQPFLELQTELGQLGNTVQGAHVAAEVLPAMLGADAPRTYLVMVQNNAEPRTTGGIPGAVLEVSVDDGRITLDRYVSAASLAAKGPIPGPLTKDEGTIFGDRMLTYPQDVNFTPEYVRSAVLMGQFWAANYGDTIDGVLSIDPVALGYMLADMTPTDVEGITITGANLSSVMLNESYLTFPDPKDQDAFFALASQQLFAQLIAGGSAAIAGTEQAISEHRFMVWSAHSAEQDLLGTTTVGGAFLGREGTLGLFVNDGSGSKIGYYIQSDAHVVNQMCRDGSLAGQAITLQMTHTFTGDVADLPWYISGGGVYVPAGDFEANVLIYPPAGEGVVAVTADGTPIDVAPQTHDGRKLATARVVLAPGQTVTLKYTLTATQRGVLAPTFQFTPGPQPNVAASTVITEGADC